MHSIIRSSLTELGVPSRLADVYGFVAEHGEVAARDVALTFSLTRSTAHDVLGTLVQYGFAKTQMRGREKVFVMESPFVIQQIFDGERQKADRRSKAFDELLPLLQALHSSKKTGVGVRYFSGIEGLRDALRAFSGLPGDVLQLLDHETYCALEVSVLEDIRAIRAIGREKRVRSILLSDSKVDVSFGDYAEVRVISRMLVNAPGEMSVCDDRVLLLSYEDDVVVVEIRSRAIADVCRATLELAWKSAETWGTTQKGSGLES